MPAEVGNAGCALNRKVIVGYATYGREQCAHCGEFIDSGSLLVALLAEGTGGALRPKWSHPVCFPAALSACRSKLFIQQHVPAVGFEKRCPGFVKLSATDKITIRETFQKCLEGAKDYLYGPERGRLIGNTTPFWESRSSSAAISDGRTQVSAGRAEPSLRRATPVQDEGEEEEQGGPTDSRPQDACKKKVSPRSVGKSPGHSAGEVRPSGTHLEDPSEQAQPLQVHVQSDGKTFGQAHTSKNQQGQPVVVHVHVHAAPTPNKVRTRSVDKTAGCHQVQSSCRAPSSKGKKNAGKKPNFLSSDEKKKARGIVKGEIRKVVAVKKKVAAETDKRKKTQKPAKCVVQSMCNKAKARVAGERAGKSISKGQASKAPRVQALRLAPSSKCKTNLQKKSVKGAVKAPIRKRKRVSLVHGLSSKGKKKVKKGVAKTQASKSKQVQMLRCVSASKGKKKGGPKSITKALTSKIKQTKPLERVLSSKGGKKITKSSPKAQGSTTKLAKTSSSKLPGKSKKKTIQKNSGKMLASKCKKKVKKSAGKNGKSVKTCAANKKKAQDVFKVEIRKALALQRKIAKDIDKAEQAKKRAQQRVLAARMKLMRLK